MFGTLLHPALLSFPGCASAVICFADSFRIAPARPSPGVLPPADCACPDVPELITVMPFFRNLPEPLMTFRLHTAFISAAKQENKAKRTAAIEELVGQLPSDNQRMAALLIRHLHKVSTLASSNLMTVSNLGVCFGPTLLRPEEETMAAIMDIKFCNVVVEILIENCDKVRTTSPGCSCLGVVPSHVPCCVLPQIFKAYLDQEDAKAAAAVARPPEGTQAASPSEVQIRDKPKKGPHLFPLAASAEGPAYTSPFTEPVSAGLGGVAELGLCSADFGVLAPLFSFCPVQYCRLESPSRK